jgi:hypothetical protein
MSDDESFMKLFLKIFIRLFAVSVFLFCFINVGSYIINHDVCDQWVSKGYTAKITSWFDGSQCFVTNQYGVELNAYMIGKTLDFKDFNSYRGD